MGSDTKQNTSNKHTDNRLNSVILNYEKFYNSSRHKDEEYKWENVREFQDAWAEAKEKSGEEFYEVLKPVFQKTDLLGWGKTTLQRNFNDNPEEASKVIKSLLDESEDIYERISRFKEFFDQPNAGGTKVASYFLSSLYPEKYIYFKFTEDQEFVEDLGLELDEDWKNYEDRVQRYLDFNEKMKEVLEEIGVEDKDLWNVQDLIWFYTQYWMPENLKSEIEDIRDSDGGAYTGLFALKCFFEEQEDGCMSIEGFDQIVRDKAKEENLPGENESSYIQLNYDVFRDFEPFSASDDEYGVKEEYQEYLSALGHYVDYLWRDVTSEKSYYLISHNEHPEGLHEGFLKAPYTESSSDYDGRYQPSHDLSRLDVGDKLLHYRGGEFKGYSEIEEEPEVRTNEDGEKEFYVEVDIQKFDEPRRLGSVRQVLGEEKEKVNRYYALDEKGGKAEGYLKVLTERGYKHVVNIEDPQPGIEVGEKLNIGFTDDVLEDKGLYFPDSQGENIVSQIESALNSGKHIIFTGPPGTGKTEIAEAVASQLETEKGNVTGYQMTTATADWSTFDTVGGFMPEKDSEEGNLEFKAGQVLKRFKKNGSQQNELLVIDEINRSDIDKAFGQLFTLLSGQGIQLPYTADNNEEIEVIPGGNDSAPETPDEHQYVMPESFRILATMNSYDKTSLYEMSYAFMRRFAFIRVDAPEDIDSDLVSKYDDRWGIDTDESDVNAVADVWRKANSHDGRKIGPAIAEDMLGFVAEGESERLYTDAVVNFVFPQLEGVRNNGDIVRKLMEAEKVEEERLKTVARDMLQVNFNG